MRKPPTVASLRELAVRLGVHERTVERWHAGGEMPVEKSGRYHVEKVRTWRSVSTSRNRERSGAAAHGRVETPTRKRRERVRAGVRRDELREARVAEVRLKNRQRTVELAAREAELIPRVEVGRLLFARAMFFRRQLTALARNLAQPLAAEVEPIRVQQTLEDALLGVLEEAYANVPAEYRE